jgi:hypothetical protein
MKIRQTSFSGGEISPELWARSDLEKWASSLRRLENFLPRVRGSVENRPGFRFVNGTKFNNKKSRLWVFQFSIVQWYVLEFGDQYIRFYKDDGVILGTNNNIYEIATPYTEADLPKLKFEQSADILYIFSPNHKIRELTRTAHNNWTLSVQTNGTGIAAPTITYSYPYNDSSYGYAVTAVNSSGVESLSSNVALARGRGYTLSWAPVPGAEYYNVYEIWFGAWAFIMRTELTSIVTPTNPSRDVKRTPPKNVLPFETANNYPAVGAFHDQRLYLARTNNRPQTIWGSRTGDFRNHNRSSPVQDDDGIQFTIDSSSVNEIRWLASMGDLIIGTSDSEWIMTPAPNQPAITPSSVKLKIQSRWGCADLQPYIVGEALLFVDGSQKRVRDMGYSLEKDGYAGDDLTVLAQHLFDKNKIVQWGYARYPDAVLWVLREDGVLCSLTYHKGHKVYAWARHTTDGVIESVVCPTVGEGKSQVWVIVRRTVGGQQVRYVERLAERDFDNIKDAFFVDSGLTYSGPPATTISGLSHLNGRKVVAFADGNVVPDLEVSNGSITLPNPASKVHVGLPYTCVCEPIGFDYQVAETNSALSVRRQVSSVIVGLRDSRELWAATAPGYEYFEVPMRDTEDYGDPIEPFTGDKEIFVSPSGLRDARVSFEVRSPVPCTITSVTAVISDGQD